jgi:hypothetical protein
MDEDDVAVCAHCDLSARIQAELAQARIAARCADADLAALCDAELTRQEWLIRWRAAQRSRANESALTAMLHDMLSQPDRGDPPDLRQLHAQRMRIEEQSLANALDDLHATYALRMDATYGTSGRIHAPNPVLVRHCKLLAAEIAALTQELAQVRRSIAEAERRATEL